MEKVSAVYCLVQKVLADLFILADLFRYAAAVQFL